MPTYWGKPVFTHQSYPELAQKQKTEKKKKRKKKKTKVGDNNGQATHGARKHAWRVQAAWANVSEREELGPPPGTWEVAVWYAVFNTPVTRVGPSGQDRKLAEIFLLWVP